MGAAARIPPALTMRVLLASTLGCALCFAAWTMFGVTGIPIREQPGLDSTQLGVLTAMPVFTEALL